MGSDFPPYQHSLKLKLCALLWVNISYFWNRKTKSQVYTGRWRTKKFWVPQITEFTSQFLFTHHVEVFLHDFLNTISFALHEKVGGIYWLVDCINSFHHTEMHLEDNCHSILSLLLHPAAEQGIFLFALSVQKEWTKIREFHRESSESTALDNSPIHL
jgi:hypothetical protein